MGDDAFSRLAKDSMSHGMAQQSAHVKLAEPGGNRQLLERCLVFVLGKPLSQLEMVNGMQTEQGVVLHIKLYPDVRGTRSRKTGFRELRTDMDINWLYGSSTRV